MAGRTRATEVMAGPAAGRDGDPGARSTERDDEVRGGAQQDASLAVRPQSLLLTLCAHFLLDQPGALFTGSFVEALTRAGVGEHAARTTLTRMCQRGLLARSRVGAKVYLSLTTRGQQVLRDAETRVWLQGAVNHSWSGEWTVLSFSLPESRRAERHQLRKRLAWEGFGMIHSGLWITPSAVDVPQVLSGLNLDSEVKVFKGAALAPTDVRQMVEDAWDLDALADGYSRFLERWGGQGPGSGVDDALARYLLLLTEWLLLVRMDPHLPAALLPPDWPAMPAEQLVVRLRKAYEPAAWSAFEGFADRRPASDVAAAGRAQA
ncbi:PaaX family transcriptional regulator C-terminal domain-containing protein [Nonomuraea sp. NPDC049480]|uniref:PaaX family transcriptional regulator n=1 Tax=Nonomuraea sp. NPDC049480 TaxID=3364353 RepID=UPI0037A53470